MAKKKKTQLKPVDRGFATISVPKKVIPIEEDMDRQPEVANIENKAVDVIYTEDTSPSTPQTHGDGFDPDLVEEQSLQNLIDKFQEKTEREITRIGFRLAERIIALSLISEGSKGRKMIDEPEERVIARLGITYGVLRRLGFSDSRVEECLRSIDGIDLEDAYEWLYLHCPSDELEEKRHGPIFWDSSRIPSQLDANAPVFVPSRSTISPMVNGTHSDSDQEIIPHVTAPTPSALTESGEDSLDEAEPIQEYVDIKIKIDGLMRNTPNNSADSIELRKLRQRLAIVEGNYFLDKNEAEQRYRHDRKKAEALALNERLRAAPSSPVHTRKQRPPDLQPSPPIAINDIFDNKDGESSDGLLELLDEIPAETSSQGKIICLRGMPLPKHWSGRTPKILLKEMVAKLDRYAAITSSIISGSSRAVRASVSIRWEGKKMDQWEMEDTACYDDEQAGQYIATVALHALTFPPSDGFAIGNSLGSSTPTFFRLLPALFRDFWDELEMKRKMSDDAINRSLWAKLRAIIEPRIRLNSKANTRAEKQFDEGTSVSLPRAIKHNYDAAAEHIIFRFKAQQSSPAYQEMLNHRNKLPIAQYRDEIIRILEQSQVLVLSGETGCGKSTQVPAFILEDQLSNGKTCKIYCTEPRRISAISLAQRVSLELGDAANAVGTLDSLVGYSIRLESNTSRNTRLAFVTNGIALRMLEGGTGRNGSGTAFDEITHIIIDEVHERTIESDFLLIVLKSLLQQRSDLKVILMSATVDAEKISAFFGNCPTLHVPGRTFPVEVKFLEDAIEYTNWTISDNSPYARRIHDRFYRGKNRPDWMEEAPTPDDDDDEGIVHENVKLEKRYSPETTATINLLDERLIPYDLVIRLLERICFEDPLYLAYSAAILVFMPGLAEIRRLNDMLVEHPAENQGAVFDVPPHGMRKIVIATNIAETGITIPDITCVIDTGKYREMRFDEKRQISRLVETFVAKSNAAQRRGRAGRVQQGLCFHLFTKIRHDTLMADHPLPEMMRLSLSDLALRIKIMKIKLGSSIEDVLSKALDPPVSINVQRAISMLVEVRALTPTEEITPMGRLLSKLPTDVHLGKFLLIATLFRCLDPALTIAAALNSKSPFVSPFGFEQEADRAKNGFRIENSDFLTIHNAFASWRKASSNPSFVRKFCRVNYLSHQNLQQIEELRQQFLGYLVDSAFIQVDKTFIRELSRSRYGRNRTRFVTVPEELNTNSDNYSLLNAALAAGLYPKILTIDNANRQMRTISNNQQASFHPSSVNFGRKPTDFGVNHLAYFTLMHSKKLYAWETGPVDDMSMLLLCGECESKLISDTILLDKKIRFQLPPKTNIAVKLLRNQLGLLLSDQFRGKILAESQITWNQLSLIILGKAKIEDENTEQMPISLMKN
ncbi:P-loop containing nucleoside triphosphate hydrolase protein [Infundibulicybe gibba]|nr:P-loop containing nucleoside triphosphate hydrolase protein [Infundibulicybe gibba]